MSPTPKEDWSQSCDAIYEVVEEKIKRDHTESGRGYGLIMQGVILAYKMAIELDQAPEFGEHIKKWVDQEQQRRRQKDN